VPTVESVAQVLTEIRSGDGMPLSVAARQFPGHRGGRTVNPSTIFRWITGGAKGANGTIVKLEAARVVLI